MFIVVFQTLAFHDKKVCHGVPVVMQETASVNMNDSLTLCSFQVDGGCNVKLQLDLRETKCHTINPKPFEDCEIRGMGERVNAKQLFA